MGGGGGRGTVEVRGEEGREFEPCLDLERGRVVEEDMGPVDKTGVGACTCIDRARVGRGGSGKRPRLMEKFRGAVGGDGLCGRGRGERVKVSA